MRAVLCAREPLLVRDHPEPSPGAGEALIKLRAAGICHTDLELARGYMGYRGVLGHEFVGEVLSSSNGALVGKRVVADINAGCGRCDVCRRGDAHHCPARTVLGIVGRDGAMADRFAIPESCLVPVPESVSDDAAVFAEPLAAALHVLDDAPPGSDPIVVLGDGKLGQLVARAVIGAGREAVVVGRHDAKLALVRAAGARAVLESELRSELDGASMVVEATGRAAGIALALRIVRPRGTVVLKTTIAGETSVDLSPAVINELKVVGSRCGDLERAVSALADRRVDPTPLIAARYPLEDAPRAFAHAKQPGALKILLHP